MSDTKPFDTSTIGGRVKLLGTACARTLKGLPALLPLMLISFGLAELVGHWSGELMVQQMAPQGSQGQLIAHELTRTFVVMIVGVFTLPLLHAGAIYQWMRGSEGKPATIKGTLNFALSRYKRMLGPHAASWITVQLGMIIVVPGLLFGLQYAFVDCIAALDDNAKKPLVRSQKFSYGRRGRIAFMWLAIVPWYIAYSLVATYQATAWGVWAILGLAMVNALVHIPFEMAMCGMYQERIHDAKVARAAKKAREDAAAAAEGGADEDAVVDAQDDAAENAPSDGDLAQKD